MGSKNVISILSKSIIHFQDDSELRQIIESNLGCDIYGGPGGYRVTNRADEAPPTAIGVIFLMALEGRVFHSLADIMVILIDILAEQLEITKDSLKPFELIPMSEKWPEEEKRVLVVMAGEDSSVTTSHLVKGAGKNPDLYYWRDSDLDFYEVTHWAEIQNVLIYPATTKEGNE